MRSTAKRKLALGVALAVSMPLFMACKDSVTPQTRAQLPTLERPLLTLNIAQDARMLIPNDALIERAGVVMVFVLRDNEARTRMVKRGKRVGKRVEIISGLMGDETLVVGQLTTVHDGSPIISGNKQGR